jgi:uncharacterized membrane protein YjjP (DUF1212 family)
MSLIGWRLEIKSVISFATKNPIVVRVIRKKGNIAKLVQRNRISTPSSNLKNYFV